MQYRKVACLLWLGGSILPQLASAANSTTITVKVIVVAPTSCTINDDQPIEVDFGDVMTTLVDGGNYRMPVNYTLLCKAGSPNAMKLQVRGNGASFDSTLLSTNKAGLGIALQRGDGKQAINSWMNFTYPDKPELWAVPVKQRGATLTGGEFSAGATMIATHQ
ncbi:fimbrial protein [Serratia liquefaciens]|uniref:fimbrial protein n=1 Tax=Serratia liquefaciens TaxID=614 RepID=UPI0021CF8C18|nr:fimbrial protein [Serratia liquefaciens]